jgi:hypothetical protein
MKKLILSTILVLFTVLLSFAQTTISITNKTSEDLYGLYTSGTKGDLLPEDLLEVSTSADITYPEGYDCEVVIQITREGEEGEEIAYEFELDICEAETLVIYETYYLLNGEKHRYDE